MTESTAIPAAQGLSIVILAKSNTSYTLRKLLDSLRNQTIGHPELLIADCNVPGDPYSLGLQEDIGKADDLRLLSPGDHATAAEICNAALKECHGEFIAFIDGCDEWYPDKASRQLHMMSEQPSAAACCCNGYCQPSTDEYLDSKLIFDGADEHVSHWLATDMIRLASQVIFRKESLLAAGGFDPKLNTSLFKDALIRLSRDGDVVFIEEPLFINTAPMGSASPEDVYADSKHLFYKHYDMLLRDRRQYQAFSYTLASQAKDCTLWLHMAAHAVVGFFKKPLHALGILARKAFGKLCSSALYTVRELRLAAQTLRLHQTLQLMRKGKAPASGSIVTDSVPAPETLLDSVRHNAPLSLANNQKLFCAVIPDHMTIIHRGMFANCSNLQRVVIPSTVTRIEAHAFQGCRKLQFVDFQPDSRLEYIGSYAFAGCQSLTGLELSGSLSEIGEYAFMGCTNLSGLVFSVLTDEGPGKTAEFPVVLNKLPNGIFAGCSSMKEIMFPEGALLNRIGNDAFTACANLNYVYFSGDIDSIGSYAFAHCEQLETFVMPKVDAVSGIGHHAFTHCRSLAHFRLPFKLTIIPHHSFSSCTALKYIKIPKNVTYIEPHAFAQCSDLESAIITSRNTKYAPNSFESSVRIDMAC